MRLETMSGRMSILRMRMRTSPGNETNMMTSSDGEKTRATKPMMKPRNTEMTVSTSSRFSRNHFHGCAHPTTTMHHRLTAIVYRG